MDSRRNPNPYCLKPVKLDFRSHENWEIFSLRMLRRHYEVIPLVLITGFIFGAIPFVIWDRMFRTTIDVRFGRHRLPRYEMTSHPTFIDLRNPRNLKFMKTYEWEPTIHLDNRYRLMRGEPMLDANGRETNVIGEDETGCSIELPPRPPPPPSSSNDKKN